MVADGKRKDGFHNQAKRSGRDFSRERTTRNDDMMGVGERDVRREVSRLRVPFHDRGVVPLGPGARTWIELRRRDTRLVRVDLTDARTRTEREVDAGNMKLRGLSALSNSAGARMVKERTSGCKEN